MILESLQTQNETDKKKKQIYLVGNQELDELFGDLFVKNDRGLIVPVDFFDRAVLAADYREMDEEQRKRKSPYGTEELVEPSHRKLIRKLLRNDYGLGKEATYNFQEVAWVGSLDEELWGVISFKPGIRMRKIVAAREYLNNPDRVSRGISDPTKDITRKLTYAIHSTYSAKDLSKLRDEYALHGLGERIVLARSNIKDQVKQIFCPTLQTSA